MVRRSLSLLAVGFFLMAIAASSQDNGNASHQHRAIPQPTNLQVLPKDTTGPQVIAIMRGFAGDLGVECSYCHAKDPATGHLNFASDANPMKNRARVMMRMTHAINTEFLTQLTEPKSDAHVTCGTCHRGMSTPPEFVPPPHEHHEAAPAAPAAPPSN